MSSSVMDAILAVEASPLSREEGARLCDAYIAHHGARDAERFTVLDVERPWHMWLDDYTLVVGQKDARLQDDRGPFLLELKTHKEARRTKAGEWYKGESPDDWLQSISAGPQLAIYAMSEQETTGADTVRIMVRAAVKSHPVQLWPPNELDGIFLLNRDYIQYMRNALMVRAAEIRAARATGLLPHDFTGYKCTHMYGRECTYYAPFCSRHLHPTGRKRAFSATDPGALAIAAAVAERGIDPMDPRLVILSASAYEEFSQCREKGRITQDGLGAGDDSEALQVGSCFHSGIAAYHRELQIQQQIVTGL